MNPIPRLKVSGKAHELALRIFEQTRGKAWSHEGILRERVQRVALAVTLHIMRGARDESRHNFPRALDAALAALRELGYCLTLARDLGLLTTTAYATLEARAGELERMLVGLRYKVRSSGSAPRAARGFRPRTPAARLREPLQPDRTPQSAAPNLESSLGVG
ncbi:MAG: four helix bundle protein [Gemmatimonadaceae bacterium]